MKTLLTFVLIIASSAATNAAAEAFEYTLEVKGMVCAFCAYNVSKQIESLSSVASGSVDVNLAEGRIEFRSEAQIEPATLSELVEAAGFELEAVAETAAAGGVSAIPESDVRVVVRLTVDADGLADGEFDALLEALGVLASERSAELSVRGSEELEMRALRPVLMGRRPAMDVRFEETVRPNNTVLLELLDQSHTFGSAAAPEER